MSISDTIVVMEDGIVQQIGKPQDVYDSPVNLFVAKFLGTPAINVFEGRVEGGRLFVGDDNILAAPGVADMEVYVGVRPEGFVLEENGPLSCALKRVEVMGRDTSVVSSHPAAVSMSIRSIISAENRVDQNAKAVRFSVKPNKTFIFSRDTWDRIPFSAS